MKLIDISDWKVDDQYSPYPEGSRDKYAVISPKNCVDPNIVPNHRYLLKFSNPRYPVQFWSEIIAYRVAEIMGVAAPASLLSSDPKTGELASLTSWFYGPEIEAEIIVGKVDWAHDPTLEDHGTDFAPDAEVPKAYSLYVPGSSYMARFIRDYDFEKGRQHNLKTLRSFVARLRMKYGVDYWPYWAMIFTFDAIIGNTDRHQDNWGVLWRRDKIGALIPRFAPAFDNGTSLLHEMLERKIQAFREPEFLTRYIERGTHHIRAERDSPKQLGHLELLAVILKQTPSLATYVRGTLEFSEEQATSAIHELTKVDCAVPLSEERADAIIRVIMTRRQIILENVLGNID